MNYEKTNKHAMMDSI